MKKSSRRVRFRSPVYTNINDQNTPESEPQTTQIPIQTSEQTLIPIPVHVPPPSSPPPLHSDKSASVVKIQSAYRSHLVRSMIRKISAVKFEADRLESLIQRQETVDAIRSDEREKLRMNEALMSLLLQLDSVPGVNQQIRELRRRVSRRIVGLQEILDAVSDERVSESDELLRSWEEMIAEMEGRVCEDIIGRRRGEEEREMERYCVEKLGFRCLERFLRGV
ncbi:IQ motif [Macleaya cordata]|uniref:IQ motif n=1 Tax=Macleaya cordata TaxID=56857 RepID=A0A200QHT5_MACCD|nr:IQ motif [Macleaya cordata]